MSTNPFDEVEVTMPQESFLDAFGVQNDYAIGELPEDVSACDIRKAMNKDIFTAHPDPEYQFAAYIVYDAGNQPYLVTKTIAVELGSDAKKVVLILCQSSKGDNFIFPLTAITPQNAKNGWVRSMHKGMSEAQEGSFIRISADQNRECYRIHKIARELPVPQWPGKPFAELLQEAFGDRIIKSMDHPVIQEVMEGLL